MAPDTDDPAGGRGIASAFQGLASAVRSIADARTLGTVLVGVTAGYSLSVIGTDVVALPVVGPAPGLLVGGVGLAASVLAYREVGCCGSCGSWSSGITGGCDCEDSCSYEP